MDVDSPVAKVMPGICSGEDSELMLCIYNDSPTSITVERGDVLAVARALPAGFVDHRCSRDAGGVGGFQSPPDSALDLVDTFVDSVEDTSGDTVQAVTAVESPEDLVFGF